MRPRIFKSERRSGELAFAAGIYWLELPWPKTTCVGDPAANASSPLRSWIQTRSFQDPVCDCRKVICDEGTFHSAVELKLSFCSVAGADEHRFFYSGVPAAFEIDQLVANKITFQQIEPEFVAGIKEELRRGLAARARLLGRFG